MTYHFISIGGAVMHNLALALHNMGHTITGSDDEIFEPAKSRLAKARLQPEKDGWYPEKITTNLDGIILGMHARADNPELIKAKELGLKIYSFPEFVYEQSKSKQRIVIGGSHGKTTSTAMLMHILKESGKDFDYLVGSQLEGFETMVKLSNAPLIVIEGDEYLTSPLDLRPKFHLYLPQVAMLTGIAWDHINVFPTFDNYVEQFRIFVNQLQPNAPLTYFDGDRVLHAVCEARKDLKLLPYSSHPHAIVNGKTYLIYNETEVPILFFGEHNLQNLSGVKALALEAGVSEAAFYEAIATFGGTARRMETIKETENSLFLRDFAHSPSKLKATVQAVKQQFPDRKLVACFELYTFSSLNKAFLKEYTGSMDKADIRIVYFNPHTFELKRMEVLTEADIHNHFGTDVKVFTKPEELHQFLSNQSWQNQNLLLMSSGTFNGMAIDF